MRFVRRSEEWPNPRAGGVLIANGDLQGASRLLANDERKASRADL